MNSDMNSIDVIIVEDDKEIARLTKLLLESEGFCCLPIYRGDDAIEAIRKYSPKLVILDVMLPGKNGVDVCKDIRQFYDGGILMLTGCDDDIIELAAFKYGVDDYVLKPLKPHLLLARVKALLNRTQARQEVKSANEHLIKIEDLTIDLQHRLVLIANERLDISSSEFELLELLAQNLNTIISRRQCCSQLRGFDYDGMDRSIDMRVSSIRKKLNAFPNHQHRIMTIRGKGYMLVDTPS